MDPGERNRLVTFQTANATADDYGGQESTWTERTQAWARVRFGTGQERRVAAQDQGSQIATFECAWTPALAQAGTSDRIEFDGASWDIAGVALIGMNRELHFTAIRAS